MNANTAKNLNPEDEIVFARTRKEARLSNPGEVFEVIEGGVPAQPKEFSPVNPFLERAESKRLISKFRGLVESVITEDKDSWEIASKSNEPEIGSQPLDHTTFGSQNDEPFSENIDKIAA